MLIVLKLTSQVYILSLKLLFVRIMIATVLCCASVAAQAQLSGTTQFFDNHFRAEATDAQDGPKLHTEFRYNAKGTLVTSNLVSMNNDGYEDHMALGMVQNFGTTNANVTYNLHRFDYSRGESQSDDVTLNIRYHTLRVQQRLKDTAKVSTVSLPVNLIAAHLDLSFRETHQNDTTDTIDEYRFVSRFNRLKFSATWTNRSLDTKVDIKTEFRPSDSLLMTYTYTAHGNDLQRQFRSEYTAIGFRMAGEFMSMETFGKQTHVVSAIGMEKDTNFAALKLRLENDDSIGIPTIFFKLESLVDL